MDGSMQISVSAEAFVDENLYSRQLYVMGHAAQRKMAGASVLFVGLNGLGVETAKNVILAGVKSVTLLDDMPANWVDMSAQFYVTESDLGFTRAQISASKLAELNPYVPVSVISGELTPNTVKGFTVVVLIDQTEAKITEIADHCHNAGIIVLVADVRGVFGSIFCDFGRDFVVSDSNGEQVSTSMIAAITRDYPALVTVLEESRHNLQTGDTVVLTEVLGLEQLNGMEFTVTVKDPFSFEIQADTSKSLSTYERGGYVAEVKQPVVLNFEKWSTSLESPGEFVMDFGKLHKAAAMHLGFRALHAFQSANGGSLPTPGCTAHAADVIRLAATINATAAEASRLSPDALEESSAMIKRMALCAWGQVSPVCALLGGVLGQEILKAVSGKFTPIKQWFYYDGSDSLSDEPLSESQVAPRGCRYDGQIAVYGEDIQSKLGALNVFLVGAGAIGCEVLKNFAMMGVAAGSDTDIKAGRGKGKVHVTDMDHIEKSNLSRQFLFRNSDISKPKSSTAVNAVTSMNTDMQAVAFESKVAPETENIFGDSFFESLDIVCAALDNVEARLYLDQRCLFYHTPMLESGTLGTKGHTQIVVPGKTEHYGASRDPPEKSIPLCTLKSFPNQIEHTLQWAREWFEEIFTQTPSDVNQYLSVDTKELFNISLAAQQNMKLDTLSRIKCAVSDERPKVFTDCVLFARLRFEDLFNNKIQQLMHSYPLDRVVSSGSLFWSGAKKPPSPIEMDPLDPLHLEFISATASLRARMHGVPFSDADCSPSSLQAALRNIHVPAFSPKDGVTIATTEEEAKQESKSASSSSSSSSLGPMDIDGQCDDILKAIPSQTDLKQSGFSMTALTFEKDDDSHMRVIAAVGNLRARNYKIPEADLHTARGIAGKITPAISTTTALVTGAVCLEIFKLLQDKPLSAYSNTFTSLGVNLFTSMEPQPPNTTTTVVKGKEWKWTQWDRIDISDPAMTLAGLIDMVQEEYGAELSMLSHGVSILFSNFMNRKKAEERKPMTLKAVAESVTKKEIPPSQKYLIFELIITDAETDDEIDIPYMRLKLF